MIKRHEPNTFFDFPFCGCNLSIKDGLHVTLPSCDDYDIITKGGVEGETCTKTEDCNRPCHGKFLEGCSEW